MKQGRESLSHKGTGFVLLCVFFGMPPNTMPYPYKAAGLRVFFFLRCASFWRMDSNSYSELHPRSFFQITLPFEKKHRDFFLEHKLSGYLKSYIPFTKCGNGNSFSISIPVFAVYRIRFLKDMVLFFEKPHTKTEFSHIPTLGMNTTIPDTLSAVKPLWTGRKRNGLGKSIAFLRWNRFHAFA